MLFDAVVLTAIIISSIVAFLRGFIRECLTIVGVVGGLLAAYFGGPRVKPVMYHWLHVDPKASGAAVHKLFGLVPMNIVADVCAYGIVFLVVVIVLSVMSHFLSTGAKAIGLGPVDRTLGVVFGIGRAAVLVSLLYLPIYLTTSTADRDEWFKGSHTRVYIEAFAGWIAGFLPKDVDKTVDEDAKDTKGKLDQARKHLEQMDLMTTTVAKGTQALDSAKADLAAEKAKVDAQKAGSPAFSSGAANGYKPADRQNLNQLIETNQHP